MSQFRKFSFVLLVVLVFALMISAVSAQTPTVAPGTATATRPAATATVAAGTATATRPAATATVAAATATRPAATATVTLPRTGEPLMPSTTGLVLAIGALLVVGSLVLTLARRTR